MAVDSNNEAAVSLSVALPEGATRAAGADSALGAIDNGLDMGVYDIRFILEVYDMSGAAPELAKERMVKCGNETTATFNFRLVPGRSYNFVVWADFVLNDSEADLHYNTNVNGLGLRAVAIKDWTAIDESRDAYTESVRVDNYNGTSKIGENGVITLTRPFAKLRVVTNDIKEMISIRPSVVKVNYFSTKFYTAFDALYENPIDQTYNGHTLTVNLAEDFYANENPEKTGVQTLFADYFFAKEGDRVMFTMDVETNHGPAIPQITFNTNIPVNRNNLTTVYGPILTDANNVTVTINPAFENPELEVKVISGHYTETVALEKSGTYIFEDLTVNADEAAAVVVSDGVEAVIAIKGYAKLNGKQGIVVEDGAKLTIEGISETRGAERAGSLEVVATEGSAIGGKFITINNLAALTAKALTAKAGDVDYAYGIGDIDAEVTINNTKIDYVSGAFVQPLCVNDPNYGKSEPEGASAIGGKKVVLNGVELVKAEGGSKAAAIGNRYWQNTEVVIKNSTLGDVFGGNASAAIGGSRYSGDISAENKQTVKIKIENSTIKNAVGGQFGAGIGAGYDTHCAANDTNAVNHIEIINSNITAQGGKYAAGIGTGFHSAALTGSIDAASVINATSGEKFYKDKYTAAQNIGYGIVDPAREYKDQVVTFTVAGEIITEPFMGVNEGVSKSTDGDEYMLSNASAMTYIAEQVNNGETFAGKTIYLDTDIDLAAATTRAAVANFAPIGTSEKPFSGTFDGNGKTIKNLSIVETEAKEGKAYIGFFGYAKDATIKNVTFENVNINIACLDIDHSQGHIGAIAGSLEGNSTIENVTVKGDIYVEATPIANGASRVAVVAGGNSSGNVTMKNVHVIANEGSYLKANNNVGALAGQLQGKSVFENCSSNIDVTGTKFFAGGIIGLAAGDQLFTNCHTTGDVTITAGREGRQHDHYRVGGIAGGWADGATKVCTLNGCSYTGELSGTNADGSVAEVFDYAGFVGRGYTLNNCAGSKVVIDGVSYVQVGNTAAEAGVYNVFDAEGNTILADGVVLKKDGVYYISNKAGMFWFANEVNVNKNAFSGKTVKLTANIDLENAAWTPVGQTGATTFNGVFDGQEYVIRNLKIDSKSQTGGDYSSGLFGWIETHSEGCGILKNVKIMSAEVEGNHNCGALVGYITEKYAIVDNCSVASATIKCYVANGDANGDKAGALIGNATNATLVKNCTATDSTVSAGRDAGQVIGAGREANVTGCSATNVTVSANGTGTGANVRNEVIGRLL